ncbi:beta-1,4-glucuronyltransferase 1-like [Culex pipiens pallens]|uniref:beta-1,4-glucuronyltransferase 1-like n=1 Tax=Culex pipiens pallens TaxID=42434 RepID=UPI0022AB0F22|nr:beta-1,4-glucuronyltransferase 1-like [Culex pipiens pallens]
MFQTCRLWNLSIASVLALTLSNVFLTVRLLHNGDCSNGAGDRYGGSSADGDSVSLVPRAPILTPATCLEYVLADTLTNNTDKAVFSGLDLRLGRWDSRRMYKFFDFAVVGERFPELSERYSVCLATQSSLEKIYSLVQVSHHWSGPISAAIFAAGNDELYLLQIYLSYLRNCFKTIRERVSFHLALPKERAPTHLKSIHVGDFTKFDCAKPEATLNDLIKLRKADTNKWRIKNPYPQNHLRNVARKGCQSTYVFLTDVDIIPSVNFAEHLDKFLRTQRAPHGGHGAQQTAFVVPTYELDERVRFPRNKTDLIRLANKGLARPFHHKVFIYNQFATNFSRWQADIFDGEMTRVSHNVTNFEFLYEPFYVAPDTVPPHDERFLGYGYTRNTQVYEMFVAGYQFQVLTPLFTVHWGLQNKKSRPAWRERQNNVNRKYFEIFKREVFARYHKDPLRMLLPKKVQKQHGVGGGGGAGGGNVAAAGGDAGGGGGGEKTGR